MEKILIDPADLKKLHEVQQEILDEIVRICKKNNLIYFLVGGTLLGAVRHKGFIPWDDDLDIGMPRKDYEKLLEILPKELNEKYLVDNKETNKKYYLVFTKIRKKDTIFEENTQIKYTGPKGIWIDIFPFDDSKNTKNKMVAIQRRVYYFFRAITLYKNKMYADNIIKKIVGKLLFLSNHCLLSIQDKIIRLQNNKNGKAMINLASTYDYKRELFNKDAFFPVKELEFEGKLYNVPNDYDKVLSQVFGDYMKLPPKEQQVTHNPVRLSFDISKDNI